MDVQHLQANEHTKSCPVCATPLEGIEPTIEKEHNGQLLSFCAEECFRLYLDDPELFTDYEDEEDE
jgi:YHS domain-containing protein